MDSFTDMGTQTNLLIILLNWLVVYFTLLFIFWSTVKLVCFWGGESSKDVWSAVVNYIKERMGQHEPGSV